MPNMNDFLTRYFEQRHFNRMPPAERARFNHYLRDNNLVGDMPHWRDNLMHRVGDHYEQNPLTPWAQLDPPPAPDRERLYSTLQNIFYQLYSDTDAMSNGAVANFVNRYFVIENIFDRNFVEYHANPVAEAACTDLYNFLNTPDDPLIGSLGNRAEQVRQQIELYLNDSNIPANQRISFNDFRDGLNPANRRYNANQNFQTTLRDRVLARILGDSDVRSLFSPPVPAGAVVAPAPDVNLYSIFSGFTVPNPPPAASMAALEHNYQGILNAIHDNKDVAEAVKKTSDGARITGPLEAALKRVNYEDEKSPNHVPPEFTDTKAPLERIRDGVKDFADDKLDSWGRILTLRGTRRFFSKGAKDIVDAIKKAKTKDGKPIKPTDGLKGILAAKDDIAKALAKSPQGREHFKWFTECMTAIQAETGSAFNGALKNPKQMRNVVAQVIYRAVQSGKATDIDAAKSTMEVLSTMKYSLMDSATIDALRDGLKDTKWLSDDKLSWNKYEGVKFVTSAFDKAAKYAMLTVGRGVAAIRNAHNLTHLKFRGNDSISSQTHQAHQAFLTNREHDRTTMAARAGGPGGILANLAGGGGASGVHIANAADLANARDVILPGLTGDARANLQFDIDQYVAATQSTNVDAWNQAHPDRYNELMAFWDTLETHWISHRFTFSAKALQDRFQGTPRGAAQTRAETVWQDALARYRQRYGT